MISSLKTFLVLKIANKFVLLLKCIFPATSNFKNLRPPVSTPFPKAFLFILGKVGEAEFMEHMALNTNSGSALSATEICLLLGRVPSMS